MLGLVNPFLKSILDSLLSVPNLLFAPFALMYDLFFDLSWPCRENSSQTVDLVSWLARSVPFL